MANEMTTRQQVVPQYTFSDLERMAKAVAGSGLFGVKTEQQALSLMLLAQAEGQHPAIAARDWHIIEGRPSLKADTMLARFQAAGGDVEWHTLSDTKADATFTAPNGKSLRMDWDIERAKMAGLVRNNRDGSPGMWMKYPRGMLRSRLASEAIRTVYPQVISGVYTPEELRDGDVEMRDITPSGAKSPDAPTKDNNIVDAEIVDKVTGEILTGQAVKEKAAAENVQAASDPGPSTDLAGDPVMDEKAFHDYLANIDAAATSEDLKVAHSKAYAAAHAAGDGKAMLRFEVAKKAAKYKLTKGGAT